MTNREADTADKLRTASLGLGVAAGVLGAAGLVFVLAAPKREAADVAAPPAGVSMSCAPAGLGVLCGGAF